MSDLHGDLLAMRRELIDKRRELKNKLTQLAKDITALDRVLAMRDPAYRPEAAVANSPRMGKLPYAHGELTTAALEVLREASQPMTVAECAQAMLVPGRLPAQQQGHQGAGPPRGERRRTRSLGNRPLEHFRFSRTHTLRCGCSCGTRPG